MKRAFLGCFLVVSLGLGQIPFDPKSQPPRNAEERPATPPPAAEIGGSIQFGGFTLQNASLTEVVDTLAKQLKINYLLPKGFAGSVTLNSYGELKNIDARSLLDLILRTNGYAMVQAGDVYRVVPLNDLSHQPLNAESLNANKDEEDSPVLNLIFLKYITADEIGKVLDKFVGEGAQIVTYQPANLMMVLDSRRNMRRLLQLVELFDDSSLANQRVRLYDLKNTKPSDLARQLEEILKSVSLSGGDKTSPIKLVPVDRINTLIAVAPNPGAFDTIGEWVRKLDAPPQQPAGAVDNYVYRVKYAQAEALAAAISALYSGTSGVSPSALAHNASPAAMPQRNWSGMQSAGASLPSAGQTNTPGGTPFAIASQPSDVGLTGTYLGNNGSGTPAGPGQPHIVPNPLDNTLLIQASAADYNSILKLLTQIDTPPRQVLIDAKIYEVDLSGALSAGVDAYLQNRGSSTNAAGSTPGTQSYGSHQLLGSLVGGATNLSIGAFVGHSREMLSFVSAQEAQQKARTISTPSVIATDSIPASINVGQSVPTITSEAVQSGVQVSGTNPYAQTIQNVDTGLQLQVLAHVTPAGVVTLMINQDVSSPIGGAGSLTPSFQKRNVTTQVTVQDGDTIAIGGAIQESVTSSTTGLPGLSKIPVVGLLFGQKQYSKSRTELIVFLTPHVLYDTNSAAEASDELRNRMKSLQKIIRDDSDK